MFSSSSTRHCWYALRVKSRFERIAVTILESKKFEIYLPTYRRRTKWSDRIKETETPLFAGYLFCRFEVDNRLPILTTSGVLSIVGNGRTPVGIRDEEIGAVRRIVQSGVAAMPWPFLRVGQSVVIRRGPLEGLEGVLVSVRNSYRIVVSVSLLQRSVSAEIDADSVCASQPRFLRQATSLS